MSFPMKATKFRPFDKDIYGFDIETYDNNKKFYMGSLYSLKDDYCNIYFTKDELIDQLKKKRFWNAIVIATNLSFDFFGLLFNKEGMQKFNLLMRGSNLLTAKTYFKGGDFTAQYGKRKLTFLDTMNYTNMSVAKWGKFLKLQKLDKPACLGRLPKNDEEKQELIIYNKRDSEISAKALQFLYNMFQKLGANCKPTIASTAMSRFKNNFLKDKIYWPHNEDVLLEQFEGYYGGRTEALARGRFKNYNYYDFNSLYPDVMRKEYPDPNSLVMNTVNKIKYIDSHEGMARVELYSDLDLPVLPFHYNDKVMFCNGTLKGWFTNVELRKAIDLGCVIKKIYKNFYYRDTCHPFTDYINELYAIRQEMKKAGDPMEWVCKILMNSLYGKFGQKFLDKDNLVPDGIMTMEMFKKYARPPERLGDFFRVIKDCKPSNFCFPIWAAYTTSYGRLKLYDYMRRADPIYVDTDSLITKKEFDSTTRLGGLKLEHFIKDGVIVRPKFYMMKTEEKEIMRIKGITPEIKKDGVYAKMSPKDFLNILSSGKVTYRKFMKIRESLRRGFIPNEILDITKQLSMEDNKRIWPDKFDYNTLQHSLPLNIDEMVSEIQHQSIPVLTRQ